MDTDTAHRFLKRLRDFARGLDDDERALLAVIIGPGVARALEDAEVGGFGFVGWESDRLAVALVEAHQKGGLTLHTDVADNDAGAT